MCKLPQGQLKGSGGWVENVGALKQILLVLLSGDLLCLLFNLENENQYPSLLSPAVMVEKVYR